jgi:hypothetical protein
MGPNRRAQERQRAAARAAAEAKRAEAERKAIAEAERISPSGTRGKPAAGRCGSTRRSAPRLLPASRGSPTRARSAANAAPSTCARLIGTRGLRSSLIPSVSCRRCSPNAPFARLEMLTAQRPE